MVERPVRPEGGVEVTRAGGAWRVAVRGKIDDRFGGQFVDRLLADPAPVLLDLDGVTQVSSFGVREWMRALQRLANHGVALVLARCRPAIVAQLNSVQKFAAGGQVVSFYCPYECASCKTTFDTLVDVRHSYDVVAKSRPPPAACPSCGAAGVFDDVEDVYFEAIAAQPPLAVPPSIAAVLDGDRVAVSKPLRVAKVVEGDITGLWLDGALDGRARLARHAADLEGDVVVFLGAATLSSTDGVERLRDLTAHANATVYLADVPPPLGQALLGAGMLGGARVVSLLVPPAPSPDVTEVSPASADTTERVSDREVPLTPAPEAIRRFIERHSSLARRETPYSVSMTAPNTAPTPASAPTPAGGKPAPLPQRMGRYDVIKRIGIGGMAEILLGKHHGPHGFEKKVVIKRILPHLAEQPAFIEMFLEEARIAARLVHSNVVQIYDLGQDGEDHFIVMEYVPGVDLYAIVRLLRRMQRSLPIGLACRIIADCCAGLHAAHRYRQDDGTVSPILHRDVSPQNVMVGFDGAVKIMDFGVAKASDSVRRTDSGRVRGKIIYMSPEQLSGERTLDARMDVFSTAVVLYLALTLRNPFQRASDGESMRAIVEGTVPPMEPLRPDVPPELRAIVARGLAPLEQRYQSARQLQIELEGFLEGTSDPSSGVVLASWLKGLITDARDAGLVGDRRTVPAPFVFAPTTGAGGDSGGDAAGDEPADRRAVRDEP